MYVRLATYIYGNGDTVSFTYDEFHRLSQQA